MRQSVRRPLCWLLPALLLAGACAGTPPTPAPTLLIVGVSDDAAIREAFESATVAALHARGVDALASSELMPTFELDAREQIVMTARRAGAEGIVVVRALGLSADGELVERSPGTAANLEHMQTFYEGARQMLASAPGPDRELLVTTAYRTSTQELIWGGMSWTFELDDGQEVIDEAAQMLADNISQALAQRAAR